MIISWLKRRKYIKTAAASLYQCAVAQSRDPRFYTDLGVSDTLDGRFDLVSMHVFLIMRRLQNAGKQGKKLSQALFDHMFKNMDFTLREIGVGDLSVPRHMHKMMKAFNGRVHSYHAAINDNDLESLELAVVRNIYRAEGGERPTAARLMAEYISMAASDLLQQDINTFMNGQVFFPAIPSMEQYKHA
jgi:cytochrome b pre-mRNA-processing protein 3